MWFKPFRLLYITWILTRFGIFALLRQHHPNATVRKILTGCPLTWCTNAKMPRAQRIQQALEKLGPIFIKVGQQLATRADLFPEDIIQTLTTLQEHAPPFSGTVAQQIVEQTYQQPIQALFKSFDLNPLASASLAQVHAITLHDNRNMVIKILRPNIQQHVKRDLSLILLLGKTLDLLLFRLKRLQLKHVVLEIQSILLNELDLQQEAANASKLKRNTEHSNLLYVPEIYWPLCRKNCLVMERVYGIPVSDLKTLRLKKYNLPLLAQRALEILIIQCFQDRFFHADLHAGNFWVSLEEPDDPNFIALDFGIMGHLTHRDQHYLAKNFLAVIQQQYDEVARLHIESGWIPDHVRVEQLEMAIATVCEPIFRKPLNQISFGKTVLGFIQIAKKFDMQIQPQLLLMQKTLINVEGIVRQLDPNIDLWQTTLPILRRLATKQMAPQRLLSRLQAMSSVLVNKILDPKQTTPPSKPNYWKSVTLGFLSSMIFMLLFFKIRISIG